MGFNSTKIMADTNKILTIFLAVIICIAAVVLLYINLPKNETKENTSDDGNTNGETEDNETEEPVTVLTVIYGDEQTNYTLKELESMETLTGYGGSRKSTGEVKSQGIYTGVPVSKLVELIAGDITNYSLFVISINEEGEIQNKTYNYTTIQGNIEIYNSTDGTPIGTDNVTMIVCYEKDGEYLDEDSDGKIKIAFVNQDEEKITASSLWWKFVVSIEIIES